MLEITNMSCNNLKLAIRLWNSIPDLGFSLIFDTEERLTNFLNRNHGLSSVAFWDNEVVGALLCGHDGRRGFFYHLGVAPKMRRQKIASRLVEYSFQKLRAQGIDTCFLFTNDWNADAQRFWKSMGFECASHVLYHSRTI